MPQYNDNLKLIKKSCNIDDDNTDFDIKLRAALSKAYEYINIMLERYTTVPLTGTIPRIILEIEADIGGGYFKEVMTVPVEGERTKRHILRERGEELLNTYIATKYQATGENRANFFRHNKTDRRLRIDAGDDDLE